MDLQKLLDAEAFHRFAAGGLLNRDGFLQAACASDPSAGDLAKRVWSSMKDDGMSMSEAGMLAVLAGCQTAQNRPNTLC